jgi:hypothetical protein
MGMLGNLEDFSLPKILEMFEESSKSGKLSVWSSDGIYRIWFHEGKVIGTVSPQPEHSLRNFLQSHAEATDALKSFLDSTLSIERPLGLHLQEKELVSPKLLSEAFFQQIQIGIYKLIDLKNGQFRFTSNLPYPYLEMTGLSKGAKEVATQGLRQVELLKQPKASLPEEVSNGSPASQSENSQADGNATGNKKRNSLIETMNAPITMDLLNPITNILKTKIF